MPARRQDHQTVGQKRRHREARPGRDDTGNRRRSRRNQWGKITSPGEIASGCELASDFASACEFAARETRPIHRRRSARHADPRRSRDPAIGPRTRRCAGSPQRQRTRRPHHPGRRGPRLRPHQRLARRRKRNRRPALARFLAIRPGRTPGVFEIAEDRREQPQSRLAGHSARHAARSRRCHRSRRGPSPLHRTRQGHPEGDDDVHRHEGRRRLPQGISARQFQLRFGQGRSRAEARTIISASPSTRPTVWSCR